MALAIKVLVSEMHDLGYRVRRLRVGRNHFALEFECESTSQPYKHARDPVNTN